MSINAKTDPNLITCSINMEFVLIHKIEEVFLYNYYTGKYYIKYFPTQPGSIM